MLMSSRFVELIYFSLLLNTKDFLIALITSPLIIIIDEVSTPINFLVAMLSYWHSNHFNSRCCLGPHVMDKMFNSETKIYHSK